jgi:hypothetical protein
VNPSSKLRYAFRNSLEYSGKELGLFLLTTAVSASIAFLFLAISGFLGYGDVEGLIVSLFFFAVIYFVFLTGQKTIALYLGCSATFTIWRFGPFIALFISFYTLALFQPWFMVPFLYLGTFHLEVIPRLRLGSFRHAIGMKDLFLVGVAGPLALILFLLLLVQPLFLLTGLEFFRAGIYVGALILFFSSLPLPYSNGANIFMKSVWFWLFTFFFSLFFLLLLLLFSWVSYVLALLLALAVVIILRLYVKKDK